MRTLIEENIVLFAKQTKTKVVIFESSQKIRMEKLEKDQRKLQNLIERIGEVDEQLRQCASRIDAHVERLLLTRPSAAAPGGGDGSGDAQAEQQQQLELLHDEERQLADDLAKRREATLILRQRVRSALVELRRAKEPSPDLQEAFTRIFASTSMARSIAASAAPAGAVGGGETMRRT